MRSNYVDYWGEQQAVNPGFKNVNLIQFDKNLNSNGWNEGCLFIRKRSGFEREDGKTIIMKPVNWRKDQIKSMDMNICHLNCQNISIEI